MNFIIKTIATWILFLLGSTILFAQVTIGSDKVAVSGALLQLKEFETSDAQSDGKSNSRKGLGMPRVLLQAIDGDLALSMGLTSGSLDAIAHTGITIYNPSGICSPIIPGIYSWNGTVWQYLGGAEIRQNQASFNEATGILTDFEGNKYTTQMFGSKRWMTQNLRSIRRADGSCIDGIDGLRFNPAKNSTSIPVSQIRVMGVMPSGNVSFTENGVLKTMTNEAFVSIFGLMYTWDQSMVACPAGWHVASPQDWTDLVATLGSADIGAKIRGNSKATYKTNESGAIAYVWGQNDPVVTISGFNALPAGWIRDDQTNNAVAFSASSYWWMSSAARGYRHLGFASSLLSAFGSGSASFRFSVRCVKD